jgi:hypothetical protein
MNTTNRRLFAAAVLTTVTTTALAGGTMAVQAEIVSAPSAGVTAASRSALVAPPVDPDLPDTPGGPFVAPDPIAEGTPMEPSGAPRKAQPEAAPRAAVGDWTFQMGGYRPIAVPDLFQPWRSQTVPRVDTGVRDAAGVRKFVWNGKTYDHPVGQAQYGLQNLNTYRRTNDLFYLNRALLQANRLIAIKHEFNGGWYYPYEFDWASAGAHTGLVQRAPWYSGMAQGEATGFFAQLAQVARLSDAQRATYRDAADKTFVTMTIGPEAAPWVVHTDAEGYLWLEEYPQEPETASDFTYNGHLFATLGMWDYAMLTGSEVAADIFDGALTTAVRHFPSVRNVNWYSDYCVQHDMPHRNYHIVHMNLMLQMQWLSGRPEPAAISDAFVADYPPWGVSGQVIFAPTKHTFYKFTSTGGVSATKTLTFSRQTGANSDLRIRIQGRGIHYRITNGAAAGWYVPEAFGRAGLKGHRVAADYAPARTAIFPAGRQFSAYRFDAAGNRIGAKTSTFAKDSMAPFDRRAVINGRTYVRISAGGFTDMWIPPSVLRLDG